MHGWLSSNLKQKKLKSDRTKRTTARVIDGKVSYKSQTDERQQIALEASFISALALLAEKSAGNKSDWINNAINNLTGLKMSATSIVRCSIVDEFVNNTK